MRTEICRCHALRQIPVKLHASKLCVCECGLGFLPDVAAVVHAVERDLRHALVRARDRALERRAAADDGQDAAAGGDELRRPAAPCRRETRSRRQCDAARRGRRSARRSSPTPGYPPTPGRRRRRRPAPRCAADVVQDRHRQRRRAARREIVVDQRQDDLRFGIAEAHVELDHLRAVARQHQAGIEKAAVLVAFGAHARSRRDRRSRA